MNRKKIILILTGIESMLFGLLIVLYLSDVINIKVFAGIIAIVSVLITSLLVVTIKKLD